MDNINKSSLSNTSKQHYAAKVAKLQSITGKDLEWILDNCNETLDFLNEHGLHEPQTIRTYINTVLAIYKHNPEKKGQYTREYKKWVEKFKEVDKVTSRKYMTLTPSKRQIETYVPWAEIIRKRDSLRKDSREYLMLSLYTMIEPARADYNKIRIYTNRNPTPKEIAQTPNYLLITPSTMVMVLNEFKSRSRNLQKYEEELPTELQKVIRISLAKHPREYLIVSPRTNQPYDDPHSYTVYFDRMLERIFKKKVTINMLRHSHIISIDWSKMTPLEAEEKANRLMHSVSTMSKYRLLMPETKNKNTKSRVCKTVCKEV